MRYFTYTFFALLALLFLTTAAIAQDEPLGGYPPADQPQAADQATPAAPPADEAPPPEQPEPPPPAEEGPAVPNAQPAKPAESETGLDEYIWEDQKPAAPGHAVPGKPGEPGAAKVTGKRKVTIDAVVIVNYKFTRWADSYNIKYHVNMGGSIDADVGMIKGNAKVATDIGGFLAKSSAFECLLKVSIADIPYEIMFKKVTDTEADINVSFKGQILEDWESLCTFLDASGAKFNTRGMPEKWIGVALEQAKPPLTKLIAPIDQEKTTTLKFAIPKHTVDDGGLGSADVEGTGVVTIQPEVVAPQDAGLPASQQFDQAKGLLDNE